MPLDGHAHLVSQGWSGKGTGLRNGAIAKPIHIVQKKSLAGVGKDRDEAFPFWDHVFQAASVSIQVKVHNSDDESDSEGSSTPNLSLERTKTGIISNRRPTTGTPALSGATTPSEPQSLNGDGVLTPKLSVMAQAKQQSARRMLYAIFYRGPVLSTDDVEKEALDPASLAQPSSSSSSACDAKATKEPKSTKRKVADLEGEDKAERKRRKREAKEAEKRAKLKGKDKATSNDGEDEEDEADEAVDVPKAEKAARKAERAERRRLRAEKRARKEERRKKRVARKAREDTQASSPSPPSDDEPADCTSQGATPIVEEASPPDLGNASKRTRDSSADTLPKKSAKKKSSKKS